MQQNLNCDKAIVCFQTEDEMSYVEETFEKVTAEQLKKHFGPHGEDVTITRAPQPQEINWENINISETIIIRRAILSWVIFVIVLGVLTTAVYFLFSFKSHQILTASETGAKAIVFTSLLAIIFFNKFVLSYIIHHLVEMQHHKTG